MYQTLTCYMGPGKFSVTHGLTQQRILISRRNIPLIFVKLGKQVPFHVNIHLISFSIVTQTQVIHISLVTVKMYH